MSDATIYDLLRLDHEAIGDLLERLDRTIADAESRGALLSRLRLLVNHHTKAEEDVFYAALRQHPETEAMATHGCSEHAAATRLFDELDLLEVHDDFWNAKFAQLKDALEQHFEQEESVRFEEAQKVVPEEEALELAHAFDQRRRGAAAA